MNATTGIIIGIIATHLFAPIPSEFASPLPSRPAPTPVITPTPTPKPRIWQGTASYYSREGCVGCSPTLTMANGQPLDDAGLTVAFNRLPLGSQVKISHGDQSVVATVTDTGGFERHGRIIDLTVATKNAIGCGPLCQVTVEAI